jgi:hypothetical protein
MQVLGPSVVAQVTATVFRNVARHCRSQLAAGEVDWALKRKALWSAVA